MKRSPFHLLFLAALVVPALGVAFLPACSSQSASGGAAAAGKDSTVRDTEIVHEPCDIESKSAVKTDVNGDGKPDIISVMSGGKEVCRAVDLNFDGRFDTFVYLDANGVERRRESDFDRDGVIDEISTSQGGVVVSKQRETNLDGKLDTWDTYVGGKLTKRERDTTGDGRIDQWWEFPSPDHPECPVIASDQDADGRPDVRQDICKENEAGKAPPAAAPPPVASSAPPPVAAPPPAPPASSAAPADKGGTP